MHSKFTILLLVLMTAATSLSAQQRSLSLSLAPSLTSPVENDITKGYVTASLLWTENILANKDFSAGLSAGPEVSYSVPHYSEHAHMLYGINAAAVLRYKRLTFSPFLSYGLLTRDGDLRVYASKGLRVGVRFGRVTIFTDTRWQRETFNWTNRANIASPNRLNIGIGVSVDLYTK